MNDPIKCPFCPDKYFRTWRERVSHLIAIHWWAPSSYMQIAKKMRETENNSPPEEKL